MITKPVINPFIPNAPFLYSLKIEENRKVSKLFFIQFFSRMTFDGCSRQQKTIVIVIKVTEKVVNEFNRKRKFYQS